MNTRKVIVSQAAVEEAAKHFVKTANEAMEKSGAFYVALSGGSTPKALFKLLSTNAWKDKIDWTKVWLFWSDERCVPPTDPDSNYKMAMDAGFSTLNIPQDQIIRPMGEHEDPKTAAALYTRKIQELVPDMRFDLVMLGMGEDGHTASLFPGTDGLEVVETAVIANYIPQKECWRLSFTFALINHARQVVLYVLGAGKSSVVTEVFSNESSYPVARVGTADQPSLWFLDKESAKGINVNSRH